MIIFIWISTILASVMGQGCDEGWVENPEIGMCYNVTLKTINNRPQFVFYRWTDAAARCNELGAELASILSPQSNDFIKDYLRSTPVIGNVNNFTLADGLIWIGASNTYQAPLDFVWTDGSKLTYENWWEDFPKTYSGALCVAVALDNFELYLDIYQYLIFQKMIRGETDGQWAKLPCILRTDPQPALCQKQAVYNCRQGWSKDPATGSCFKILSEELSWEDARDQCMLLDKRSNLASITSNEENEYVKNLLRENNNSSGVQGFWTGGNDLKDEGSWVWTDESPVKFADWHNGQGKPTKNKDCIAMWKSFDYEWKDWQCKLTLPSVCKIENIK